MNIVEQMLAAPVASFIFIITIITSIQAFRDPVLKSKFVLHPYSLIRDKKYYTVITSGLIHADEIHLGMNMLVFYFFAFMLEGLIGSWQFGVLYVASLIASDITTIISNRDNISYSSLGASGAVSAVVMGFVMIAPWWQLYVFFFPCPAWLFGILYIGYSYYYARRNRISRGDVWQNYSTGGRGGDNIGHEAHLWGAIAGAIITFLLVPEMVIAGMSLLLGF